MGQVTVIEGDTIEMHGRHIRRFGADAPEAPQTCTASGRIKPLLVMLEMELVYRERHPKDGRECQ